MGRVVTLADNFSLGLMTDPPVDKMPRGASRRFTNFLPPGSGAEAKKRGGNAYASVNHGMQQRMIAWAPFDDDPHAVLLGLTGGPNPRPLDVWGIHAPYDTTSGVYVSTIMTPTGGPLGQEPVHPPFWHQGGKALIILGNAQVSQFQTPVKYFVSGGVYQTANLGGTPPLASVGASWGDYLILANGKVGATRFSNRMWFSGVGAFETWNTGTSYLDFPEEIIAVVPKGNLIFVFGRSGVHMITGDTPPPGGNMNVRKFAFGQGCSYSASAVTYKDYVIWANSNGIWKSDGSQPVDLTAQGGISSYWVYLMKSLRTYSKILSGTYRNFLFVTVMDSADSVNYFEVVTLVYNLETQVWVEWNNFGTLAYAKAPAAGAFAEELFMAASANRAIKVSGCWFPDTTNAIDANGGHVEIDLITGAERLGVEGFKRIRKVLCSYSFYTPLGVSAVSVHASLSPFSDVADPTSLGMNSIDLGSLTPSVQAGEQTRAARFLNRKTKTAQIQLTQAGYSADFRLYGIEVETDLLDELRAGDART